MYTCERYGASAHHVAPSAVCREPITPGSSDRPTAAPSDDTRPRPPRRRAPPPHRSVGCAPVAAGLEEAELAFRLAQLHQMYPNVVTQGMVSDMTTTVASGGELQWEAHPDFVAQTAEAVWQEHAAWGHTHTSASFGGGGSSGGGGGGW